MSSAAGNGSRRTSSRYLGRGVGVLELLYRPDSNRLRVCNNECVASNTAMHGLFVEAPVDVFINGFPAGHLCGACARKAERIWRGALEATRSEAKDPRYREQVGPGSVPTTVGVRPTASPPGPREAVRAA